jgi:hypothetical protein
MSTQPTPEEVRAALDVLARANDRPKYTRRQLDAMSPQQVADVLAQQPDAFDRFEEDAE